MKFAHVNIVSQNWQALAQFYIDVFGCEVVPPIRNLSGKWLSRGTGVEDASLQGAHLRLPGYPEGPTLEIYQYEQNVPREEYPANECGFGHIAFQVDNVPHVCEQVVAHGGQMIGEITQKNITGAGLIDFVYVRDPDGNIIELQHWH